MKDVLVDTDILSYIMKKHPMVMENYNRYLDEKGFIFISRISVIEIVGGLKARGAEKQIQQFQDLISIHKILDTTELSASVSSEIYAELC